MWLPKDRLVYHFGVSEDRVSEIEQIAERERKERETRRNTQQVQTFLHFDDVSDFKTADFKLVIFQSQNSLHKLHDSSARIRESESMSDSESYISSEDESLEDSGESEELSPTYSQGKMSVELGFESLGPKNMHR